MKQTGNWISRRTFQTCRFTRASHHKQRLVKAVDPCIVRDHLGPPPPVSHRSRRSSRVSRLSFTRVLRTADSRLQDVELGRFQREGIINTIAVITSGCISSSTWSASYYLSAQINNAWRPTEWLKNSNRSSMVLSCQSVSNNCWLMEITYLYFIP